MHLTKFGHGCVQLEKNGRSLVVDPATLTPEAAEALTGADAVLVTHEHFDHFQPDRLRAAVSQNPYLAVYTCAGVARHLDDLGDRINIVHDGDAFSVAEFDVTVVGEKHHFSHPDVPPVDNLGFLVDGEVFHPGDALTVVDAPILLAPGQVPWMTVPDLIIYLRKVAPRRAYAIHDGLINEWGSKVLESVLDSEADRLNADIRRLRPGESTEL